MVVVRPNFRLGPGALHQSGGGARRRVTPSTSTAQLTPQEAEQLSTLPMTHRSKPVFKPIVPDRVAGHQSNSNYPIFHFGNESLPEIMERVSFAAKRAGRKKSQEGMGVKLNLGVRL
jgi:hypothetical protein